MGFVLCYFYLFFEFIYVVYEMYFFFVIVCGSFDEDGKIDFCSYFFSCLNIGDGFVYIGNKWNVVMFYGLFGGKFIVYYFYGFW